MELLRSHGETEKYVHEQIGFNYRMNDITGAIGCSKLDRLQAETDQRRPGLKPPGRTKGADGVWHLYTVQMDPAKFTCTRDEFCKALGAEGVPTATHYPRSVTRQPAFKDVVKDHPPVADGLATRVFCLPMHHAMTDEHFRIVGEALGKVGRAFRR
jgi:perosamine synthetase